MAADYSFDVVSEVDMNLVAECVQVATKELLNRYDFKGSSASIELSVKDKTITVRAEDEMKIEAVMDMLNMRMAKRGLPLKNFERGEIVAALGQTTRMVVKIQSGIPSDKAKEIVAQIKQEKLKVNASIQAEQLRVTSKSKDELQAAMAFMKGKSFGVDLQFKNFR